MYTIFELAVYAALSVFQLSLGIMHNSVNKLFLHSENPSANELPYWMPKSLNGSYAIVTGANTGIGEQTALNLAKCGAIVVLACRDMKRGTDACDKIKQELRSCDKNLFPNAMRGDAIFMRLDLVDMQSVVDFADRVKLMLPRIDILVNNAGLNGNQLAPNGLHQLFQVNYLGHFLLFQALKSHLQINATASTDAIPTMARVVNLSSVLHHLGQPDFKVSSIGAFSMFQQFLGRNAYADSKLYMSLLTININKRYYLPSLSDKPKSNTQRPILSISVNPGAVRSDIWRNFPFKSALDKLMRLLFLEVQEGASPATYACCFDVDELNKQYFCTTTFKDLQNTKGAKMMRYPLLPYIVPYTMRRRLLSYEIFGTFHGPELGYTTLPSDSTPLQLSEELWQFSTQTCRRIMKDRHECTDQQLDAIL